MAIDLAKLRALAEAATPGPWSWFGNTKTNSIMLATIDRGRQYVMRFRRWGMGGAQPVFLKPDERGGGWMHPAKDLVVYEVDYRRDFHDIDNADARWIAAADPTTVLALIAEIERLEAERDARPEIAPNISDLLATMLEVERACRDVGESYPLWWDIAIPALREHAKAASR